MSADLRPLALLCVCLVSCGKNLHTAVETSPLSTSLNFTLSGSASDATMGPDEDITLEFSGGDEAHYTLQTVGSIAGTLSSGVGSPFVGTTYTTPFDCTGGASVTFVFSDGIDSISRTVLCRPLGFTLDGLSADAGVGPDQVVALGFSGGDASLYALSTLDFIAGTLSSSGGNPFHNTTYTTPSDCAGGVPITWTFTDGTSTVSRTINCAPLSFALDGVESDFLASPDEIVNFTFAGGNVRSYQLTTPGPVLGTLETQSLPPAFTQMYTGSYTLPSDCTGGNSIDLTLSDGTGASVIRTITCGP